MGDPAFNDLPDIEAGAKMPSAFAIATSDKAARDAARYGSERLRTAMLAYYDRHHSRVAAAAHG